MSNSRSLLMRTTVGIRTMATVRSVPGFHLKSTPDRAMADSISSNTRLIRIGRLPACNEFNLISMVFGCSANLIVSCMEMAEVNRDRSRVK